MLKRSLLVLPFLSAVSGYSMADSLSDLQGEWRGVISTSVAGYIPGANVDFTLFADTMSISEDGVISGTAKSSTSGAQITLSGKVDSHGHFNLRADDVADCQASGNATLMEHRAQFSGGGTCIEQQQEGGRMKKIYNILSSVLTKVEPN